MKKREFKVGDKVVHSTIVGYGVVANSRGVGRNPLIRVSFTTPGGEEFDLTCCPTTLRHAEPEQPQQPQLPDLTKILKVGDKVWDVSYGEVEVSSLANLPQRPILVKSIGGVPIAYTKDGRTSENFPIRLYPIDQKPEPPNWPDAPKTFEWEGEVYEAGEWVAVRDRDTDHWAIFKLWMIEENEFYPVKVSKDKEAGIRFAQMRKLSSFNQDQEPQD